MCMHQLGEHCDVEAEIDETCHLLLRWHARDEEEAEAVHTIEEVGIILDRFLP